MSTNISKEKPLLACSSPRILKVMTILVETGGIRALLELCKCPGCNKKCRYLHIENVSPHRGSHSVRYDQMCRATEIQETAKCRCKGWDASVCEIALYCPVNRSAGVVPSAEVGADLLGNVTLKRGGRPSYLKSWTVETINGVARVTKEFEHALKVHVHVVRAPEEATPAVFGVGFSHARGEVQVWCCE